ncbi:MAG: hypothetical protein ABIO70_26035 [Pseudomonadota bacterium]
MPSDKRLEVTITHNFADSDHPSEQDLELTRRLFQNGMIGFRWYKEKGPPPKELIKAQGKAARQALWARYKRSSNSWQTEYLFDLVEHGGAVMGTYKGAADPKTHRLVGLVQQGQGFKIERPTGPSDLHDLLCLKLHRAAIYDSSQSFLGNLVPRGCTIQSCHKRALGRLYALAAAEQIERDVRGLHHHDLEWLVTNYLLKRCGCSVVFGGSPSYEAVDHVGFDEHGNLVLAQTTLSNSFAAEKIGALAKYESARRLYFGPAETLTTPQKGVELIAIEKAFSWADDDGNPAGRAMISAMLGAGVTPVKVLDSPE